MEGQDPMFEESAGSQAKAWVQDNLRIIVSVFIVAAIALGIYSYSQRTTGNIDDKSTLLELKQGETSIDTDKEQSQDKVQAEVKNGVVITEELSQETETSFIEKAEKGNGTTHLARRALAHYLEKNVDSTLTPEQKVYIEDYLRKNIVYSGTVTTETSLEFSKTLISQGIEKSKMLNERQLQNLKKYSARVSAYR